MSRTPIENQASLRVGAVEFVAPDEIKVRLDLDAPDGISANGGVPREFPRINSYVLIPNEGGSIVCQVEWIAIERSPFPKRSESQDYGLIDLPLPIRKMKISPLGVLKMPTKDTFKFQRGVHSFPSIGSPVLIPTDLQLKSIIESGSNRRVYIGNSPLTANAEVKIDPDRLFGRHLAVLGNTGSGKSCTVAGLIQWSIEATGKGDNTNARFIILDPNGEYSRPFKDRATVLKVGDEENGLNVPLWLWNSSEWSAFTQASTKAQLPLLKRALRAMRNEQLEPSGDNLILAKRYAGTVLTSLRHEKSIGSPWGSFPKPMHFYQLATSWKIGFDHIKVSLDNEIIDLDAFIEYLEEFVNEPERTKQYANFNSNLQEIDEMIDLLELAYEALGGNENELLPRNEDIPIPFKGDVFVSYLSALAQQTGNEQYLEFLITRIKTMLADSRMDSIIGNKADIELDKWLEKYLGSDKKTSVTIIDLSLVPSEIVHVTTAVISRIVFEALQRYRKLNGKSLPTVLVMEEAHSFITRYNDNNEGNSSSTCTKVFEKIAREGRKFGLGLVLSSQRPSELSPTVLSQCNSFIMHRISNDRDQELVSKLLPDNFKGLLKELPSLPSQRAILLGWASELPILLKIRDLKKEQRPHSEDPDFWNVWSGKDIDGNDVERNVNWKTVADDWQEKD